MKILMAAAIVGLILYVTGIANAVRRNIRDRIDVAKKHAAADKPAPSGKDTFWRRRGGRRFPQIRWRGGYWYYPGQRPWPLPSPYLDMMQY